jgi:hypothetical protein
MRPGVTLTQDKFIVGEEVKFAGFIISGNGVKPDPAKLRAIKDYPLPSNISSLRSFLGLANQLGLFHPDLARATDGLCRLLKKNGMGLVNGRPGLFPPRQGAPDVAGMRPAFPNGQANNISHGRIIYKWYGICITYRITISYRQAAEV